MPDGIVLPSLSADDLQLYERARELVLRDRKCSTSYVQRSLSIGYNRAARLLERLEVEGVVSPANHVGKREILVAIDGGVLGVDDLLDAWAQSGETGVSSKAMAAHLAGYGKPSGAYPSDAADFRRCEGLLAAVPDLRADLARMAEVNAYWAALVPRWDEIAVAGNPTEMIKSIVEPIEDRDPAHIRMGRGVSVRFGDDPIGDAAQALGDKLAVKRGAPPMKKDADLDQATSDVTRVTREELRQFIERYERLEAEKKDIADAQKEVMAEAKGRGYDTKVLRKIVAIRKRDPQDVSEEEAVLEIYKDALGM